MSQTSSDFIGGLSSEQFREACASWTTGVSIVTTVDVDGACYGLTMNAVTSLSLTPPLFLICVDKSSDSLGPICRSRSFCINILQEHQQDLCKNFSKKGRDKFLGVEIDSGLTGVPLLRGRLVGIECRVTEIHSGGDHLIIIGHVMNIARSHETPASPLAFYGGRFARLRS